MDDAERRQCHERHIEAQAALLGLRLEPAWREQAVMFFGMAAAAADLVMALPLDDREDEAAPVFVARLKP